MITRSKCLLMIVGIAAALVVAGCGGGNGGGMDGPTMPTGDGDSMTGDGDSMTGDGDSMLTSEEAKSKVVQLNDEANTLLVSPYYSNRYRQGANCQDTSCTLYHDGDPFTLSLDTDFYYDPEPDLGTTMYVPETVVHDIVVGTGTYLYSYEDQQGSPVDQEIEVYGGWLDHAFFSVEKNIRVTHLEDHDVLGPLQRYGVLIGTATRSNPLSDLAAWRGVMVGADVTRNTFQDDTVRGDAEVTIDLGKIEVFVAFTNIRNLANDSALDNISWKNVPMVNGRFREVSDVLPTSHLSGAFFGPGHEEVGGVFEHGTLVGAFGAKRQ